MGLDPLTALEEADYRRARMRLVRVLIWLATLFFAVMMFLPLIRQIIRRVTESGSTFP